MNTLATVFRIQSGLAGAPRRCDPVIPDHDNRFNHAVNRRRPVGFSLVELLVSIAVLGLLTAIAVGSVANVRQNAIDAKDRRNAQGVASLYSSARAAGAAFASTPPDTEGIINELIEGRSGTGVLTTTTFRLSGMTSEEIIGLLRFLEFDDEPAGVYYHFTASN